QMQRVVNPAADNEGAATRQPGDATEAVRDLECLQPAASALADCIAENILRRLLLDELPVGPIVLVETAGQNEHLALVGADRDRRRTIGDVGGVGSYVDDKRGKTRSRYRYRSDGLPSWQQLLRGLGSRRNAGERTAVVQSADLGCNVLQFDRKQRPNSKISGRRLGCS